MSEYDDARAERDYRLNPPDSAPGQGDIGDGWGDLYSGSENSTLGNDFTGMDSDMNINSILNGDTPQMQAQGMQQQMNPASITSTEDKIIDVSLKVLKAIKEFSFAFVKSLRNNTPYDWHVLGERMFKISAVAEGLGVFFVLLKPFVSYIKQPSDLIIGGILSMIVGTILMMVFSKSEGAPEPEMPEEEVSIPDDNMDLFSNLADDDADDIFASDSSEDNTDIWDSLADDEGLYNDDYYEEDVDNSNCAGSEGFSVDEALNMVQEIPAGTQTRQYLFETFTRILPHITPTFDNMEDVDYDSDEFMMYEEYLRNAAYQVGTKDENIPELEEVRKNLFLIQLRATRPAGLKEQDIANEVANLYSRDEDYNVVRYGVYATVDSTVGKLIINIFTGESAMVSLNDIYSNVSDWVKDPKITMPFVWGISEMGKPYYCDLLDSESIIITGEARSGKSWKGQSIVAQLCMFNSPKDIEFYIFDHKNTASDYRYLSTVLPHVKYFCGDATKINEGINRVVEQVKSYVESQLKQAGVLNIKDYNRLNPEDKIPFRYVIIDELQSLMDSYDKDEAAEFRKLMSTIVSKLPYLGLRLIMFPHRIVDRIISKDTYSLISNRAVVRQLNKDEVKNAVGVTEKQFPYSLVNNGDMAVKSKDIARGQVVFCHAEVLTPTNEGNKDVFKFIGSVWRKLEPDCQCITIDGAIGGHIAIGVSDKELAERVSQRVTPDHTAGKDSYHIQNQGSSIDELDLPDDDGSEEDFWNDILKDN